MRTSTLTKRNAIRERNQNEVDALKADIVDEIERRIGDTKAQLITLETAYNDLTDTIDPAPRKARSDLRNYKDLVKVLKKYNGVARRREFNAEGFSLPSAINIAKGDATKFGFKQNRSQGEVWLK